MRYQWDLQDIKNKLKILTEQYRLERNQAKKDELLEFISFYQDILSLSIKKKDEKNNLLDVSIEYTNFNDFIQSQILDYKSNSIDCLNLVLQSYLPFRKLYQTSFSLRDIPIVASNDKVVEITRDFMRKYIPKPLLKNWDFLFPLENCTTSNVLQICYSRVQSSYGGITMIDPRFKQKYIYIARKNNLLDLGILPHESLHYLILDVDDCTIENYNTWYLQEVEGSFADILFGDYFYHNSIEFRNYFNQYRLQMHDSEISDLVINNAFIDSLTEKGRFRMNKLNKALEIYEIMPFQSKEELMDYMTVPMDINMKYSLGFLVAIDLFYIYQKDPEFSFYLLKNIRFLKEENNIAKLLRQNHITFMDDGYENLKKYVKKIERQN